MDRFPGTSKKWDGISQNICIAGHFSAIFSFKEREKGLVLFSLAVIFSALLTYVKWGGNTYNLTCSLPTSFLLKRAAFLATCCRISQVVKHIKGYTLPRSHVCFCRENWLTARLDVFIASAKKPVGKRRQINKLWKRCWCRLAGGRLTAF